MKSTLILMLTLTTITVSASTIELSFKEHFSIQKIMMNDVIRMDLIKIKPDLSIEERMLAQETKKKF